MIYSLSEIETQCKKALRGAGFEWGYVEEASKAVRCLAANQLPGVELLAAHLKQLSHAPGQFTGPLVEKKILFARSGNKLCPLLTGAHLCDYSGIVFQDAIEFQQLAWPLLLLPYILRLTLNAEQALSIYWKDTKLVCQAGRLQLIDSGQLQIPLAKSVFCQRTPGSAIGFSTQSLGCEVDASAWKSLDQFAYKTYVPATDVSRRGAGPSD